MNPNVIELIKLAVELLIIPFATVSWFIIRKILAKIESWDKRFMDMEKEFHEYKLYIAKSYPTQDNLKKLQEDLDLFKTSIFRKLDSMDNNVKVMSETFRDKLDSHTRDLWVRLDGKQDKH